MHHQIVNRALGAYLGFALGDALGATVEFMSPKQIQHRYGVHQDIIGGGWLGLAPGQVTDDTQMSLALGNALIEQSRFDLSAIADAFLAWLNSQPPDVGNTCRQGLLRYRDTGSLVAPYHEQSAGNGGLMRNLPIVLACLNKPQHLAAWSLAQARITHHHPLSDAATIACADITRLLLLGHDLSTCQTRVNTLISEFPVFAFQPYPGKASGYIVDTLQTILHYFFTTSSFSECLIATVNQGGDADTTGALAGMLAGAYYGVEQLPTHWLEKLDISVVHAIKEQVPKLLDNVSVLNE